MPAIKEISRVLAQLKGNHSVLLAEQNINMALGVADYVYLVSKGSVVCEGKPQELKNNSEIKNKYLGIS